MAITNPVNPLIPNLPLPQGSGNNHVLADAVPGASASPTEKANQATDPTMQRLAQMVAQALQQSQRPRIAAQQPAVPGASQPMSTTPPNYMTDRPYAKSWGPERFMYTLQSTLHNISSQKQQQEQAKWHNVYVNLLTGLDKYVRPDGTIDPAAYNDPAIMSIMGDPKTLKKLAKAEAVSAGRKSATAEMQRKQQARTGMDRLFHGVLNRIRQPQPQLTPDQQKQMAQEVGAKAPIAGADPRTQMAGAESFARIQQGQQELSLRQQQLDASRKEHTDALQEHYDSLNAQIQEHKDSLAERQLSDQQRTDYESELTALRMQSVELQKMRVQASLGGVETPKDRQTWLNNTLKELMQNRAAAAKDMAAAKTKWFNRGLSAAQDEFNTYDKQIKNLQSMSSQYLEGKATSSAVLSRMYQPARPANVPADYQYVFDGPQGEGWYKPGTAAVR
jgi:hypothetical protein